MKKYFLGLVILSAFILFSPNDVLAQEDSLLTVVYIDLEASGDSTLFILPDGKTILIDGGWNRHTSFDNLLRVLGEYDVKKIDVVITTHADADHYGGLLWLFTKDSKISIDEIIVTSLQTNKPTYTDFLKMNESSDTSFSFVDSNFIIDLSDDVDIDILSPPEDFLNPTKNQDRENRNSIVTRIEYRDIKFLSTGDITKESESWLIDNYPREYLDIDIMNAPHHGSNKTSSSAEFIEFVSPGLTIFSANEGNNHGHPGKDIVNLYESFDSKTLFTKNGDIKIKTDGINCSLFVLNDESPCFDGVDLVSNVDDEFNDVSDSSSFASHNLSVSSSTELTPSIVLEGGATMTYIQSQVNDEPVNDDLDVMDSIVTQVVATVSSIIGVGMTALFAWLRKRGIPVSSEQEKMFKQIVTNKFEKLAKESWKKMRDNPEYYWEQGLLKGKIPDVLVTDLKREGLDFAIKLKDNAEFQDFAKGLKNKTKEELEKSMEKMLSDVRARLKYDYQKRMIDVIPKLASIAVDSSFDKNVLDTIVKTKDPKDAIGSWADASFNKMKPLLMSAEALDKKENIMIILQSEINKRISDRLMPKK